MNLTILHSTIDHSVALIGTASSIDIVLAVCTVAPRTAPAGLQLCATRTFLAPWWALSAPSAQWAPELRDPALLAAKACAQHYQPVIYRSVDYWKMAQQHSLMYEQLARIGKVVMHPKRIELLELLCQGERTVEALSIATGIKFTTASAHLQIMRQAMLVTTRREGTRIYYRAAGEETCRFIASLGDLARARLAEVDQILREIDTGGGGAERITRTELLQRARAGDVVVIDVRPAEEYEAGHIPGAISLPLEHLEARLDEINKDGSLPTGREIVAYCRGPLCLLAPQAVSALRKRGRQARCLEDGMPEWRQAGLPVTIGADERRAREGRTRGPTKTPFPVGEVDPA